MNPKERPILFSSPMVCAILPDLKTNTRRVCKARTQAQADRIAHAIILDMMGNDDGSHEKAMWEEIGCPYGKPGDRLWIKETWRTDIEYDPYPPSKIDGAASVLWTADQQYRLNHDPARGAHDWGRTRVSIHMPRWASRITLEITDVRVERLQDITEDDAKAEGVTFFEPGVLTPNRRSRQPDGAPYRLSFTWLWESINGPGSWDLNPYVWVIQFRRL